MQAEALTSGVNVSGIRNIKYLIDALDIPDLTGASCVGLDPEMFFRKPGQAKRVCAGCPVKAKCLDSTLSWDRAHPDCRQQGIVGGTDEQERKRMAKG